MALDVYYPKVLKKKKSAMTLRNQDKKEEKDLLLLKINQTK